MKNFFLALIVLFLASGCQSEKTLKCTKTAEESGIEMSENVEIVFKNDQITFSTLSLEADLGDYASYKDYIISTWEESFEQYDDLSGVDIRTNSMNNKVSLTLEADFSKMDESAKEKLNIVNVTNGYNKTKENYEEKGYTCE